MSTDIVTVAIGPDNKIYVTDELSLNAGLNTVDNGGQQQLRLRS
jgi:hypothetical protein